LPPSRGPRIETRGAWPRRRRGAGACGTVRSMEDLAAPALATIPHMTPDEFRRHGAEVVEWIARYLEHVEEMPVLSRVAPGEVRAQLPPHPPEEGEPSFAAMLADVDRIVLPGITHWQSPGFFAYFPSNGSGPAI